MDLYQLECYVEVAKSQSISLAAEKLFISQPTVTNRIKQIEADVGMELFTRSGTRIKLNKEGAILLDAILNINSTLNDAYKQIKDNESKNENTIILQVEAGSGHIKKIVSGFLRANPEAKFVIISKLDDLPKEIKRENPDFHFFAEINPSTKNTILLRREPIVVCCSHEHPLAQYTKVCFEQLYPYDFIVMDTNNSMYHILIHLCYARNFSPQISVFGSRSEIINCYLHNCKAISILPENSKQKDLLHLEIEDEDCFWNLKVETPMSHLFPLAKKFKWAFIQYFNDLSL